MKVLAIETSTPSGGVALVEDGRILGCCITTNSRNHSRRMLPMATMLLEDAGIAWSNIDAIAVSRGPGSFVGVRVGLSLAKGLAFAASLPIVAVSTLEALALQAWCGEDVGCVVPLLDARVGEVYGAVFAPVNGKLERRSEDFCTAPEAVPAMLPGRALFSGEGARKHFDSLLAPHGQLAHPERLAATPVTVALLGLAAFARGETLSAADVTALYLREAIVARPA